MAQQQGGSIHGQGSQGGGRGPAGCAVSLGPTLLTTVFLWVLVLETPSCV